VSSQENVLTLKGLCCGGAALNLIFVFKEAQKALKEAGREISLPRSLGNLSSLGIVAIKATIRYLYSI